MSMKILFPPIVPSSLPAFDSTKSTFKYYFKPSSLNTMEQVNHLQMVMARLDTNRSILNPKKYPLDIIFKNKKEIHYDDKKEYYYVEIESSVFKEPDQAYKVQIRLGEDDISMLTKPEDLGAWLRDPETMNKLSEWSIVTYTMPITKPDFGIQGFKTSYLNLIQNYGYVITGYYEPKDAGKAETLSSYTFNLYQGTVTTDPSTWQLLATSGEKRVGIYEKQNISHVFNYELLSGITYIITMTVKTKNLYTERKIFPALLVTSPNFDIYHSISVEPNIEEAAIDVTIKAGRQILMKPSAGTKIDYIVDEPGFDNIPGIKSTHAKISGCIENQKDFILATEEGSWVCQFKAKVSDIWNSAKEVIENPMLMLEDYNPNSEWADYMTRVSVGAMKINLAYPTSNNLSPEPEYEYRFVVKKEILMMEAGNIFPISCQNKIIRQSLIEEDQEFYFFIKEDNGLLDVDIKPTYKSDKSIKGGKRK